MILNDKRREAEMILIELERPAPFDSHTIITWANRAVKAAERFSLEVELARALYLRGLAHIAVWRERVTGKGDGAGRNAYKDAEGDLERSFNLFIDAEKVQRQKQQEHVERQRQRDKARERTKDRMDNVGAVLEQLRCRSIQAALGLARFYEYDNAPGKAMNWIKKAIARCDEISTNVVAAIAHEALADLLYNTGDVDGSIEESRKALTIRRQLNDMEGTATTLARLAAAHHGRNEIEAALQYNTESRALYEQGAHHYKVIGEKARSTLCQYHLLTSRRTEAELRLSRHEALTALELATRVLKDYETLDEEIGTQVELAAIDNIHENIVHTYIIIGTAYESLGQLESALDQCAKAFTLAKQHGRPHLLLPILLHVGRIHRLRGEIPDALGAFRNAVEIADAANNRRLQAQFHRELSETFQADCQFEQALEHYKRFAELQELIAGSERQAMIAIQRVRFDTDQSELETRVLRERNALLENELANFVVTVGLREESSATDHSAKKEEHRPEGAERESANKWIYFQNLLDARYPGFLRLLRERAPTLTKTHLQICSLMRLGLNNKEVATALRMGLRTLQSHRNDIRKRLPGIPCKDLVTWLLTVTSSIPDGFIIPTDRKQQ